MSIEDDGLVLRVGRLLLAGLLIFELLNLAGLLSVADERVWPGLVVVSAAAFIALEVARWYTRGRGQVSLPRSAIVLGVGAVLVDAIGNILGWYAQYEHYDILVHFFSGLALATIFFFFFRQVFAVRRIRLSMPWSLYLAVATTSLAGVLFEIGEYAADLVLGDSFWLGSSADIIIDLTMNIIGACTAAVGIFLSADKRG